MRELELELREARELLAIQLSDYADAMKACLVVTGSGHHGLLPAAATGWAG